MVSGLAIVVQECLVWSAMAVQEYLCDGSWLHVSAGAGCCMDGWWSHVLASARCLHGCLVQVYLRVVRQVVGCCHCGTGVLVCWAIVAQECRVMGLVLHQ